LVDLVAHGLTTEYHCLCRSLTDTDMDVAVSDSAVEMDIAGHTIGVAIPNVAAGMDLRGPLDYIPY
jgi:hypothetical protein